jgi:exportin-7
VNELHFPLLLKAATIYYAEPFVMIPLLKFLEEFSLNRTQRIDFHISSPNGILLFKEVSKILVVYGN